MEREEMGGGRGCIGKAPEDAMRTLYHLGCRLRIPRSVCRPVCSRGRQGGAPGGSEVGFTPGIVRFAMLLGPVVGALLLWLLDSAGIALERAGTFHTLCLGSHAALLGGRRVRQGARAL